MTSHMTLKINIVLSRFLSCCAAALEGLLLCVLLLLSPPCQAQDKASADNARPGKIYTIVLSNGREVRCSHYYERDGQIHVVRSFGEISYSKSEVVAIRDETEGSFESSSANSLAHSSQSDAAGGDQCAQSDTRIFESLLRSLPSDRAAAEVKIDELIALQRNSIAQLEAELPALEAKERSAQEARKIERENRAEEDHRQGEESNERITAESMIDFIQHASGGSQIRHDPNAFGDKNAISASYARSRREEIERDIALRRCNISLAEKKRSELQK
jgi:hypothetical protein